MKEEQKRIPRPSGLTLQSRLLNNEPKEKVHKLKEAIITNWITNGMTLNGELYTLERLSAYIQTPQVYIMKHMVDVLGKMGKIMDKDAIQNATRALWLNCLKFGLEGLALSRAQVDLLLASQGAGYQPFISAAVNQSIANFTQSQTPLLSLFKALTDKNQVNILIQGDPENGTQPKYITTDQAVKLIGPNQQSMLEDLTQADAYIHAQKGLPDVGARTQDLREIGIQHDGLTGASGTPNTVPNAQNPKPKRVREQRPKSSIPPAEVLEEKDFLG